MVFIKKESFESLDEHFNSKDMDSDSDIKQEDVGNSADESDCDTMPLSEEAMAWDGLDMEQLESIFSNMRDRFQRTVYDPDNCDTNFYEQDDYYPSGVEKFDLLDACCAFLEDETLPRVYQARANLMMVWLIETETECERYAKIAGEIVEGLERNVLGMFGKTDDRVEELKEFLCAAEGKVVRRKIEAGGETDEEDGEEEEEDEEVEEM